MLLLFSRCQVLLIRDILLKCAYAVWLRNSNSELTTYQWLASCELNMCVQIIWEEDTLLFGVFASNSCIYTKGKSVPTVASDQAITVFQLGTPISIYRLYTVKEWSTAQANVPYLGNIRR